MTVTIIEKTEVETCGECPKADYANGVPVCEAKDKPLGDYGVDIDLIKQIPKWCPFRKKSRSKRGR